MYRASLSGSISTPRPGFSGIETITYTLRDGHGMLSQGLVRVWVDTGSGPRALATPADLVLGPPDPPPAELLHTAYDMWHSMGIDLGLYTRVYEVMRDRVLGREVPSDPVAATFADGVRVQAVMDAVRRSSAEGTWEPVTAG